MQINSIHCVEGLFSVPLRILVRKYIGFHLWDSAAVLSFFKNAQKYLLYGYGLLLVFMT